MQYRNLCVGLLLIATGCIFYEEKPVAPADQTSISDLNPNLNPDPKIPPLVIVGEGGTSGYLFQYAADTYVKENGGEKFTVHDGDEFIRVMKEFGEKHGAISSFVYFGHGNDVGLYVNQAPHINGGLYANDPQINAKFRAASIYDLPRTLFAAASTAMFYGCNVARENDGQDSFAEQFANHFHTTVSASTGPTEFSFQEDERTLEKLPAKIITDSLYMIPTFAHEGFVTIAPSETVSGYDDVHASMEAASAIRELSKRGLSLDTSASFHPEQSITAADAKTFCTLIDADASCDVEADAETGLVRNTSMLKLLLDAAKLPVKKGAAPFEGEIYYATVHNLLTHDFTHKRWYSRADTAILTWNVLSLREQKGQ